MATGHDPELLTELEAHCRRLRFYGMDKQYYSLEQGYNSRLDELHAAILLRKLAISMTTSPGADNWLNCTTRS